MIVLTISWSAALLMHVCMLTSQCRSLRHFGSVENYCLSSSPPHYDCPLILLSSLPAVADGVIHVACRMGGMLLLKGKKTGKPASPSAWRICSKRRRPSLRSIGCRSVLNWLLPGLKRCGEQTNPRRHRRHHLHDRSDGPDECRCFVFYTLSSVRCELTVSFESAGSVRTVSDAN